MDFNQLARFIQNSTYLISNYILKPILAKVLVVPNFEVVCND